jgi:hypothetical protein
VPSIVLCSTEHDGWFAVLREREKRAETGIGRNDDAAFVFGPLENLVVASGLQAAVAHVDGIMPTL